MSLTFTDIFCGAGGSSIGLTEAGLELKLAANHWDRAIETHSANFRDAEHLCADVSNYDMRRLPGTEVLWASPICTEISPAGGKKRRRSPQLDLLEEAGHVAAAGLERTRATFWDVLRAVEVHRYEVVLIENVVDAADWELFEVWLAGMETMGYSRNFVSVSSAHVGNAEGNDWAGQWRDRLYIAFTAKGVPAVDVDPHPIAWCEMCDEVVGAVQSWKRPGRRIGKYRQQYVYRCPNGGKCRHAIVEPYVLPAASIIDWSDIGTRIGDRDRPLAAKTMARIQAGLDLYGQPVLSPAGGTWNTDAAPVLEPMRTRTTRETDGLACPPFAVTLNHGGHDGRAYELDSAPLPARTAKIGDGIVTTLRRNNRPHLASGDAIATVAAAGRHHALTIPPFAVTSGGDRQYRHALVVPYRKGRAKTTREPLHTVATKESAGLVQAAIDINDCYFRMLKPREHLRAQRFPDSYTVTGNKGEQTMQAGNAVSANVAHWLGQATIAALA